MSLVLKPHRLIESETRRSLCAIQLVDHNTGLPVVIPAKIEAQAASIAQPDPQPPLLFGKNLVRIHQNLSGLFVISKAPLFDRYTETFDPPNPPLETIPNPLLIRLSIVPQTPQYLPRSVTITLPRSNDPNAIDAATSPTPVRLYPSPSKSGATTLIRVSFAENNIPVSGALLSVYRSPRQNNDQPIASGLTDWRTPLAGEALIEINDIPRFRPGSGNNIIETTQAIEMEAIRDANFAADTVPDPDQLSAANLPNHQTVSWAQIQAGLTFTPATNPVSIRAGLHHIARIALP